MALGDTNDMVRRMFVVLPLRWFPELDLAPNLRGMLSGIGQGWSFCFNLIVYARQQARISTATGTFLDMIAADFFGSSLARRTQEDDQSFQYRIKNNLLSEKATRAALISTVENLTGAAVEVFEPGRPDDTGGYGGAGDVTSGGGFGYGTTGLAYGSLSLPFQFLVTIYRPSSPIDPQLTGYGDLSLAGGQWASGGYGIGALEYLGIDAVGQTASDPEITTLVLQTIPVNTVAWLAFI